MIDTNIVEAVLRDVSRDVILPKFGALSSAEISTKSTPGDLVTDVDIAAEDALFERLAALCPGATFIGEERAADAPSTVDGLSSGGAFWVVDPIDGTRNFVRGVSAFGIIVAFVVNGLVEHGFIFAVPENKCLIATRGKGVKWDGVPVETAMTRRSDIEGLRSVGWLLPPFKQTLVASLRDNFKTSPAHCSAYGYIALARGEYDFALYSRIHPWDHLAGSLMLEELGGAARFMDDGTRYKPAGTVDRPMLVTAPGRDWQAIADRLLT